MYLHYWKLTEKPFENTPDPRFMYYSKTHKSALINLMYAVTEMKSGAMLWGEAGCGKTLIARTMIQKLNPSKFQVAIPSNTLLDEDEFLREIVYQFGINSTSDRKTDLLHDFQDFLYMSAQNGYHSVLIVDEAQLITNIRLLEELRLLLNFQLDDRFLLTFILMGQPLLNKTIHEMPQFSQRLGIQCYIHPLNYEDTRELIRYRLQVAGRQETIFTEDAYREIYKQTDGIPRIINNICDLSLLSGFSNQLNTIDAQTVIQVSSDN